MRQYFNWKTYLAVVALGIVGASLYYTNELAKKLAAEERKNVEQFALALRSLSLSDADDNITFEQTVVSQNTTIPVIIADESDAVIDYRNIDTTRAKNIDVFLADQVQDFKAMHPPIEYELGFGLGKNYIYYGESFLLTQLRYFPYVQLAIIMLFLFVVLIALTSAHRSIQNQVWVGLSKETAHQLGTPLSSIEAWLELLKENEENQEAVIEMQKDLDRLKLVADRFGKVGSVPQLEEENLVPRLGNMVAYMQRRAPQKVSILLQTEEEDIPVNLSGPLFDWVVENLMRNALDAMEGKGSITVKVQNFQRQVWIDITDTGKGILRHQVKKIFNPGFTTKKRGWGLGLSLSRRIIEKFHHGSLYVKNSEVGKGTTFRIILRR